MNESILCPARLSPTRRRAAVQHVRNALGPNRVSERRACRVLDQPRSTQRREKHIPSDEPRLIRRIVQLASEYGRYGYRRVTALLRAEGWRVNHKCRARNLDVQCGGVEVYVAQKFLNVFTNSLAVGRPTTTGLQICRRFSTWYRGAWRPAGHSSMRLLVLGVCMRRSCHS